MAFLEPYTISVFGLGYVGCVSAACLAQMGHQVIGVDSNPHKTELINQGKPTIVEKGIAELVAEEVLAGRLSAERDVKRLVELSDISIICVGTPGDKAGLPDLTYVWHVARQIRDAMRTRENDKFYTIMIRSTVPPGTCREFEQILAESGKEPEKDFAVVCNPEFLREGSSIQDYFHPSYTLIGTANLQALDVLRKLYGALEAPIIETDREIAEMIKYVNNSFHALKVAFANEIGMVCKSCGIDSHKVMDLFCKDVRLNISPAYLKPGFAYGGSCLPKDLRALNAIARSFNLDVSVLSAVERSNELLIERALEIIKGMGKVRVGMLGLAFKSGTDDLRGSPIVKLLEHLIGKGYEVIIYDQHVLESNLMGTNKHVAEVAVPHLTKRLAHDLDEVTEFADVIVVAQKNEQFFSYVNNVLPDRTVIDLVRIMNSIPDSSRYIGFHW